MSVSDVFKINQKQFIKIKEKDKKITFNGYKKTDVFSALKKEIISGQIEKACYRTIELHISNYTEDLWNSLLKIMCEQVNIGNTRISEYCYKRYSHYLLLSKHYHDIHLVNNQVIRNHLCETTCLLTLSNKFKLPKIPKLLINNKRGEYSNFMNDIWKRNDNNQLKTIIYNFAYCIHDQYAKNIYSIQETLYWLGLLFKIVKKHKCKNSFANRSIPLIDSKHHSYIWIIWSILLKEVKLRVQQKNHSELLDTQIVSLYQMFVSFFTTKKLSNYQSKKYLIIHAILLLSEFSPIQFPDTVYVKYELITKMVANINFFYLNSNKKQPISFNPFTVCVIDEDLGYFKKNKKHILDKYEITKKKSKIPNIFL